MSTLRDELLAIRDRHGVLTPTAVVDDARPNDAPLHDRFEWDDTIAGERWRQEQARELIRSVKITFTSDDGTPKDLRGFVSITRADTPAREYVPVESLQDDSVAREIAVQDAAREWRQMFARYKHLTEFLDLVRDDLSPA